MIFEPEFKAALKLLPDAEKDKLILRFLKQDLSLANKLRFELIETESVEEKREQIIYKILQSNNNKPDWYFSKGYLLPDTKTLSGIISEHVYTTKDKYGEISLNCLMILNLLENYNDKINSSSHPHIYKLCIYIVARMFKILLLIQKQHVDLHLEFKEDIENIGKHIANNPILIKISIYNGLDVNWLLGFNIPDNLNDVYIDSRKNGFLR
jgi:hypothetical protein